MEFNSVVFLLVFLPIVLVSFHLLPSKFRLPFLTFSSLTFYWFSGNLPLIFMLLTIFWVFLIAKIPRKNSFTLFLSISIPILILVLFKYLGFILDIFKFSEEVKQNLSFITFIVLPAGISFYTFQSLSYAIDVNKGKFSAEKKITDFACYISLFPQLIAGPIVRYNEIVKQLKRISSNQKLTTDFTTGFKFLAVGLFVKMFFSDFIWVFRTNINIVGNPNSLDMIFEVISYSYQIYFDFWSYSLMAIGLGKLFSIDLPRNFFEPYKSKNPQEFWQKWHVTLSKWIKDYIYIPLGGNKSLVFSILVSFFIVGVWHGAGLNFIIWGIYHAIYLLFFIFVRNFWEKMPNFFQILINFFFISLVWTLFEYDLTKYLDNMKILFSFNFADSSIFKLKHWLYLAILSIFVFFINEDKFLYKSKYKIFSNPYFCGILISLSIMFFTYRKTFIYFRF